MMRWVCMISLTLALLITGCVKLKFQSPLPQDGPTMREIIENYETVDAPQPLPVTPAQLPTRADGLHGYTRDAYSELDVRFPRLPNPTIIMYIFPHLSEEQTPVPGYATMFPLYETVHFALPGEL